MPSWWGYERPRRKTWGTMARWERKAWHREESLRLMNGLKPRAKP